MSETTRPDGPEKRPLTDREKFNLITDTVAGPNLRLKDNLYQGLAVLVCILLGAGIGFLTVTDQKLGALAGGFIGLVVGFLASGTFLMIYRAVKHSRGEHD